MPATATATAPIHTTREAWMVAAIARLRELLTAAGAPDFAEPLVSVGFPFRARKSKKGGKAVGQCWPLGKGERSHIFVHPCHDEPVEVLDTLLHELNHAAHPNAKHGGAFARCAEAMGQLKPWTSSPAGPELKARLAAIAEELGPFPHRPLDPAEKDPTQGEKKPGSRMRKYTCPCCGQIIRAAKDGLDALCGPCTKATGDLVAYVQDDPPGEDGEGGDDEGEG